MVVVGGGCWEKIEVVHEGRESRLKAKLDESQMTVAGAIQCINPTEFNLK